ncbi:hypothetical protein [uncultured Nostoc sp.]|uniref:hypothetical protein n=1 Tax=uncultured Nostoc sp. TaxID=340711 RepID=UPI0035CA023A
MISSLNWIKLKIFWINNIIHDDPEDNLIPESELTDSYLENNSRLMIDKEFQQLFDNRKRFAYHPKFSQKVFGL